MRKLQILFVLALLTACSAGATVLTFEDLSGQGMLPSNYGGLTWSDGWEYYDWSQFPYTPSSGSVRVYNNGGSAPPRFSFAAPVVFNGAYFAGYDTAAFEMYLSGSLMATSSTASLGATGVPVWLASGYGGPVDEVRLVVTQGFFVMDDVTFNGGSAVPEPATYAMIGLGLAGVAVARRRK